MQVFDVFNGDADGLCALYQLRREEPLDSTLITDVKRSIDLVGRVPLLSGATVNVLDVSFDVNREATLALLGQGCTVRYFDHHYSGEVPDHPRLETHINRSAEWCTSLLVDRYLEGRQRAWAVVGAFGDNLDEPARAAAESLELSPWALEALRELGILLNYNGYGATLADLHFHPVALYEAMGRYDDPLAFFRESAEAKALKDGFAEDMERALRQEPLVDEPVGRVFVLPAEPWARRVMGSYANRMANETPDRATVVAIHLGDGTLTVSVRSPLERPHGADTLCRAFPTGGGRSGAAGVNVLPEEHLPTFIDAFRRTFE